MDEPPNDLISPATAALLLGVSLRTVRRWYARRFIRSWRLRQLVRVSEADVRAMLEEQECEPDVIVQGRRAERARKRHTRDVLEKAGLI